MLGNQYGFKLDSLLLGELGLEFLLILSLSAGLKLLRESRHLRLQPLDQRSLHPFFHVGNHLR